jgi:hypothetical protein
VAPSATSGEAEPAARTWCRTWRSRLQLTLRAAQDADSEDSGSLMKARLFVSSSSPARAALIAFFLAVY